MHRPCSVSLLTSVPIQYRAPPRAYALIPAAACDLLLQDNEIVSLRERVHSLLSGMEGDSSSTAPRSTSNARHSISRRGRGGRDFSPDSFAETKVERRPDAEGGGEQPSPDSVTTELMDIIAQLQAEVRVPVYMPVSMCVCLLIATQALVEFRCWTLLRRVCTIRFQNGTMTSHQRACCAGVVGS